MSSTITNHEASPLRPESVFNNSQIIPL